MNDKIIDLKSKMASYLTEKEMNSVGLSTGIMNIDEKLPWKGLPSSGLSAFVGPQGSGRHQVWIKALKDNQGAWIEPGCELYPPALAAQGTNLQKLLIVQNCPEKKLMWTLSQVIRSRVFNLIGCQIPSFVSTADLQRLAHETRFSGSSVVLFFERLPKTFPHWLFKLNIRFHHPDFFIIEKALKTLPQPLAVSRYEKTDSLSGRYKFSLASGDGS